MRMAGPHFKKKGNVFELLVSAYGVVFKLVTNKEIDQMEMEWLMEDAKEYAGKSGQPFKRSR